jgi:hypothetical protein
VISEEDQMLYYILGDRSRRDVQIIIQKTEMNPRTVGKHVVDEPVVVIHTVFVDPPDPICISCNFVSRDSEEEINITG